MNPLKKLIELEAQADEFGFDWPDLKSVVDQAISECKEILEAESNNESKERIQEEIGDLFHTAVSLCIYAGFDVNETIEVINKKFANRLTALKSVAKLRGYNKLQGVSFDEISELWLETKKLSPTLLPQKSSHSGGR